MINHGTFVDYWTFLNFCLRPLRKHCIPLMKRKTLCEEWNPILYGDFLAAVSSFPLLPSDSWNKLTWKVNRRTLKGQPASPWRFYPWLLSLPQTPVGEWPWRHFPILYFRWWWLSVIFWVLWLIAWFERKENGVSRAKRKKGDFFFWGNVAISAGGDVLVKLFYKEDLKRYWWMIMSIWRRGLGLGNWYWS